jgi:DNA-binding transcriptional LysR family regulator
MVLQKMEPTAVAFVDVQAFATVVETGGFARAGERLGVSKSIVSRRVANLERRLGARLLVRSARGATPTDIGSDYHRRLSTIFAELETAHEAVAQATSEIAGSIRLTASISFGVEYLAPALADFVKLHPRIELDLVLEDRTVDLIAEQFDLALRIGKLPDSSLIARKLAPVRSVAVASPSYVAARGRPTHPHDLAGHEVLFYTNAALTAEWRFRHSNAPGVRVGVTGKIRSNNGEALREMARAGLGIAVLPTFAASEAIGDGSLVVVLEDWSLAEVGLYAVMLPGRATTARIRALVDFLAARFGPEPAWDPCWIAARKADAADAITREAAE